MVVRAPWGRLYPTAMRTMLALVLLLAATPGLAADELKAGDPAPMFTAKTQTGETFDLATRKGQWTVLYFYPRAGTPGCTKQADAFRDGLAPIKSQGAEVFGISTDTVEAQAEFHRDEALTFTLLADPEAVVTNAYGAKMPVIDMARRWTFIIGPDLKIAQVERDVDPTADAQRVAAEIAKLKTTSPPAAK